MAKRNNPHFWFDQWETERWRGDTAVAMLVEESRCFWFEALNCMIESGTYALSGTHQQLAQATRCRVTVVMAAVDHIKALDVADVHEQNGIITLINRFRQRKAKISENRANARRGKGTKQNQNHNKTLVVGSDSDPPNPGKGLSPPANAPASPPARPKPPNAPLLVSGSDRVSGRLVQSAKRVLDVMSVLVLGSTDDLPPPTQEQLELVMAALNEGFDERKLIMIARHRWGKAKDSAILKNCYTAKWLFNLGTLNDFFKAAKAAGVMSDPGRAHLNSQPSTSVALTDEERKASLAGLKAAIRR